MGIHKQLPLEKERPACHLTPIVMLDSPSVFPAFSSLSLSFLPAMCPCLTCFGPKSAPLAPMQAQVWPTHTSSHQVLQSHHLHLTKENFFPFFFPFSHSCPLCKVLQFKFTPGLLCANHFPFIPLLQPTPTSSFMPTAHLKGCRHLQAVFVTPFLYLPGLTSHPGNKDVTLPSNKFIIINFHSWAQNNGEF